MNILVVDNETGIVQLVSRMLGRCGHRVVTTTDARHACETIELGQIDLLISDVEMAGIPGPGLVAVARRLRSDLPVPYMSATEQPDGYPFLSKPFQAQELVNAIHRALAACASRPQDALCKPRTGITDEPELTDSDGPPADREPLFEDMSFLASR